MPITREQEETIAALLETATGDADGSLEVAAILASAVNAAAYDASEREPLRYDNEVTTTDDTPTDIMTLPTVTDEHFTLFTVVRWYGDPGIGSGGTWINFYDILNVGGTVIPSTSITGGTNNIGSQVFQIAASGTDLVLTVTGIAATTIKWRAWAQRFNLRA